MEAAWCTASDVFDDDSDDEALENAAHRADPERLRATLSNMQRERDAEAVRACVNRARFMCGDTLLHMLIAPQRTADTKYLAHLSCSDGTPVMQQPERDVRVAACIALLCDAGADVRLPSSVWDIHVRMHGGCEGAASDAEQPLDTILNASMPSGVFAWPRSLAMLVRHGAICRPSSRPLTRAFERLTLQQHSAITPSHAENCRRSIAAITAALKTADATATASANADIDADAPAPH